MVLGGALRGVGCVHGVRWCLARGCVCVVLGRALRGVGYVVDLFMK